MNVSVHPGRLRVWIGAACLVLWGCAGPSGTPSDLESPTPIPWHTPVFTGDGLPASENTDHETEDTQATPVEPTGEEEEEPEEEQLFIADGLFGYSTSEDGSISGLIALLEIPMGCYEYFNTGNEPDGLFFRLRVRPDSSGAVNWAQRYDPCGLPPCSVCTLSNAGESETLEEAWVEVDQYDPHYVTVTWETGVSAGQALTFYNCAEISDWYY